ncbi:hypothetical protein [Nibricoccus aquaticus]|uniref:hypothetical protein n=1 Tax=Nibricoccus aquaticus TaxID=2576891 RepID=UPI0015868745|nr:hypothetical protein [Nibricoccus aquaticus]
MSGGPRALPGPYRSRAPFRGDGAEFFDGDKVFERDDAICAAEEGDGVLAEAGEVADAFDGEKHVEDAAVGFFGKAQGSLTGNSSVGPLMFYQRNGFRITGIEQDFF